MTDFVLPVDGSIVVVDDKLEDAIPLIELLSSRGVACTYYSGTDDKQLPNSTLNKVRIAFFDIQLFGPSDATNYATNISRLLNILISELNGPYILILWTTIAAHEADTVEDQINANPILKNKRPLKILRLEKTKYFKNEQNSDFLNSVLDEVDETLTTSFDPNEIGEIKGFINDNIFPETKKVVNTDAIEEISEELNSTLQGTADSFQFFTHWEGAINSAAGLTVNHVSSLYQKDEHWSENFKNIIFRMARAQLGQNISSEDNDEILKNSLKTMNGTFLDLIESHFPNVTGISEIIGLDKNNIQFSQKINTTEYRIKWKRKTDRYQIYIENQLVPKRSTGVSFDKIPKQGRNENEKTDLTQLAESYQSIKPLINTMLLLDLKPPSSPQPGNVYLKNVNSMRKRTLIKNYLAKKSPFFDKEGKWALSKNDWSNILFIELEASPICDFAQKKWVKYRLLPGVMVPENFFTRIGGENFYDEIPLVRYNNINYKIIFDFRLFKSIDMSDHTSVPPIFRIRNELSASILSRLSSHASRIGISSLE